MKILNLSVDYSIKSGGIYSDLNEELVRRGHSVTVVFPTPSISEKYQEFEKKGVRVFAVKTGPIQKVSYIKKGISFISMSFIIKSAVKKLLANEHFDLITFTAPPVTFTPIVAWAKKYFNCPAFLMQKDIFPQNALDLKLFSKRNPVYYYFRHQEKTMLKISDFIGCMSQGNIDYILKHNPFLNPEKLVYFPNTQEIAPARNLDLSAKNEIRKRYCIAQDSCIFLFGGNMGKPQYLPLICSAMRHFNSRKDIFWLAVGRGTDANLFPRCIAEYNIDNAIYLEQVPREQYHEIAAICDVGLVTLNPDYTIPNIPSKTLSYMEMGLPILAATDLNTDYPLLIQRDANCGLSCNSADENAFFALVEKFSSDKSLRRTLGENGRNYMQKYLSPAISVDILEKLFCNA